GRRRGPDVLAGPRQGLGQLAQLSRSEGALERCAVAALSVQGDRARLLLHGIAVARAALVAQLIDFGPAEAGSSPVVTVVHPSPLCRAIRGVRKRGGLDD